MKYIDEYRDEQIARSLAREIAACSSRNWVLVEICGGQTHTIMPMVWMNSCRRASNWFTGPAAQFA
jgi:hydrogenase maturation factor